MTISTRYHGILSYLPVMNGLFESRPLNLRDRSILIVIGIGLLLLLRRKKILVRRLG